MHALLVSVESASEQLVDRGPFRNNSRFTSLWTQENERMQAIAAAAEAAIDAARRSLPAN